MSVFKRVCSFQGLFLLLIVLTAIFFLVACTPEEPIVEPPNSERFSHTPPGVLIPSNSGKGFKETHVFAPDIIFPVENPPAYINSQVYGIGGMNGAAGSLCDARNFRYPWHDNYCEKRRWTVPLCPGGKGHQGVDIRPATCERRHWAVAVEDGTITKIGSYTVYLRGSRTGTVYRYLHLKKSSLRVRKGQKIRQGDRIGIISDNMGSTKTSIHLHFDMKQTIRLPNGRSEAVYVPPYTSLVNAYLRLLKAKGYNSALPVAAKPTRNNDENDDDLFLFVD